MGKLSKDAPQMGKLTKDAYNSKPPGCECQQTLLNKHLGTKVCSQPAESGLSILCAKLDQK